MKGYIIVDIPVDDPIEINEYGMYAKLQICPSIPSKKKELYFDIDAEIRPLPERKEVHYTHPLFGEVENLTNIGYNKCLDDLGETE